MLKLTIYSQQPALQAVLAKSGEIPPEAQAVRGWDFDNGCSLDGIMNAMLHTGIQATALGRAVQEVNRMVELISLYTISPILVNA